MKQTSLSKSILLHVIAMLCFSTISTAQTIQFEDISEKAGIYTAGGSHGVAVHDFNADGWEDFYIAASEGRSALFLNNGDETFTNITEVAGVSVDGNAVNPLWGDINNDGVADLFVGVRGPDAISALFLGNGHGGFIDVSERSGLNLQMSIGSAAFGDYDGDGRVDLFLGTRDAPDLLFRNTGQSDTLFTNTTGIAGISGNASSIAMQATWNDYDRDGDLDLFAVHDGNLKSRFYNQKQAFPLFADISDTSGLQVSRSSMGVSWGDYNNDGWSDVYITNIGEGNLFKNNGNGTFSDVTAEVGVQQNGMSWGIVFADFDNDGDEDLFIGNTFDFDGSKSFLYENRNGTFVNIAEQAGADLSTNTFGVATGDFNNDGLQDLIVADEAGKNTLLLNRSVQPGNWITLDLQGTNSNKMAIGASVFANAGTHLIYRNISGGGSFCSQIGSRIHIGLGDATLVDTLVVAWDSGDSETFTALEVNKNYTLVEGAKISVGTDPVAVRASVGFLEQNYPNPFSGKTNIVFVMPEAQHVSLKVYDVLGREVDTIVNDFVIAGRHQFGINLQDQPAGIFFYKLITSQKHETRAMIHVEP